MKEDSKELALKYKTKKIIDLACPVQICAARFSPCGNVLAAACFDGSVRRWDSSTDKFTELTSIAGHNGWVQAIAFHPTNKVLYSADSWGKLIASNYLEKDSKPVWKNDKAHDGWIRKVSLSPDGKLLATCGTDKLIKVWSAIDGSLVKEFKDFSWDPLSVSFTPDSKAILVGDLLGKIAQVDTLTGKKLRELDASVMYKLDRLQDVGGVRCFAFDSKGEKLACGGINPNRGGFVQGPSLVIVFDWKTGKEISRIQSGSENDGYVYDLLFITDSILAGVSSGQPGNGKVFFNLMGETQPFISLATMPNCHSFALHPAGKKIAVVSTNANSSGNGKVLDKNKDYATNHSPINILEIPT